MQFQHGRFRFHDYLHDFLLPGTRKGGR
jgi:hypothetical protein